MGNTQEFVTVIRLNDSEAKNNLQNLKKKVDDLKMARDKAISSGSDINFVKDLNKDLKSARAELKSYETNVSKTIETIENLGTQSLGNIEKARRSLRQMQRSTTNPEDYKKLQGYIDKCTDRIDVLKNGVKSAVAETENLANVMSNINGASINQLTSAKGYLTKQLSGMTPQSTSYAISSSQLNAVNARINELWEKQKLVNTAVEQYNKEIREAGLESRTVANNTELIDRTMKNLSTASVKDLQYSLKMLNEQMVNVDRGSKSFHAMSEQAKHLRTELEKVRAEGAAQQSWINKATNWFNRMQSVILSTAAAVTGLLMASRKSVDEYAQMDQEMTNVRKYTGQSAQEVERMNGDFQKMDTRTGREQLNQFADAAGRLGITSTKSIEEFVDAADKISVALGDDLGDGAVNQIGKLAQAFGQDKTMGLRGAMIATGSAVNDLAQSSSANAGYIVDFTARLAGVGLQAKISQQNIMGYASVLDQNMQNVETSATSLSQLITKMYQDPVKFAKLAGQNVKTFAKLLKTDANQALLTFLASMKGRGGFSELSKMFSEMGLDGTRCVAVLSTLASKLNDVQVAQGIANKSYAQGTSVLHEFNTQNSSVQAQLDKNKKHFKEIVILLGQELYPAMRYTLSGASLTIKALHTLITFTKKHAAGIAELTIVITALTAAAKAQTIAAFAWYVKEEALLALHKAETAAIALYRSAVMVFRGTLVALQATWALVTKGVEGYIVVMRAARMASITTPWGAFAAVLTAVGVAVYALAGKIKAWISESHKADEAGRQLKKSYDDVVDIEKEASSAHSEEISKIKTLRKVVMDANKSYNERHAAILQLQRIVPSYHAGITQEGRLINNNIGALDQYINDLNKAAIAQAALAAKSKIQAQLMNQSLERGNRENNQSYVLQQLSKVGFDPRSMQMRINPMGGGQIQNQYGEFLKHISGNQIKWINRWMKAYNYNVKQMQGYDASMGNLNKRADKIDSYVERKGVSLVTNTETNTFKTSGKYIDPKAEAKAEKERKKKEREAEQAARKLAAAKRKEMEKELKAAKANTDAEQAQNILSYNKGQETYRQYVEKQHKITIAGIDKKIEILKKFNQEYKQLTDDRAEEEKKADEDHTKFLESDTEKRYQMEVALANAAFNNKNNAAYQNEDVLNERLYEAEMTQLADKLALEKANSEDWLNTKAEMEQRELDHQSEQQQNYMELLANYREQWGRKDIELQKNIALKGLDTLHERELISEKEYQEMLKNIKLYYAKKQAEDDVNNSSGVQMKNHASDAAEAAYNEAKADFENKNGKGTSLSNYLASDIQIYTSALMYLDDMEKHHLITHEEHMQAWSQTTANMLNGVVSTFQTAYDKISPILDGMSSYYSAQSDYEVAVTEKKYQKMIDAAGNNSVRQKKLQEKEQKETNKIKEKYARKQMKIQIAEAISQTAMSAISAYASVMKDVPYPANMVLAPINAGLALAAGAIQIATIKKQQTAQEAQYYTGGFTGGDSYKKSAGIVHQGEFVANHQAVNNTRILPALQLIDQAQRNNTVGSLTESDISRSLGRGSATVVSAPTVNITTDNSDLNDAIAKQKEATQDLISVLAAGINAKVYIDGDNGVYKNMKRFENRLNNI